MAMPADVREPKAGNAGIPLWLVIMSLLLVYLLLIYFDENSGWFKPEIYEPFHSPENLVMFQPRIGGFDRVLAQKRFHDTCSICHQDDGMGRPGQFPPLAGSEWVNGTPNRLIRIPLLGISGPIKVKGQAWNLSMPGLGSTSDEDLALILTYVRSSWGNRGDEIKPAQVKAIRAELGGRTQLLGGEAELEKIPDTTPKPK